MTVAANLIQNTANPNRDARLDNSCLQEKFSNEVNELLDVLDKDIRHIQESLSWLNELRSLVIKRDDTALSKLLQIIRAETDNYAAAESHRRLVRKKLADALDCSIDQVTISMLQNMLPEEQKLQIEDKKTQIRALIKELRQVHLSTALLLSDCARFNNQLLKALFELGDKGAVLYRPDGATEKRTNKNFVNMRL
jgi:flagellar biosynthesis/type III secretory pathway chaperone